MLFVAKVFILIGPGGVVYEAERRGTELGGYQGLLKTVVKKLSAKEGES